MNDVPAIFIKSFVSHSFYKKTLLAGSDLSGLPGHFASEACVKRYCHTMWLRNGRLAEETMKNCENQELVTETLSRKHLHYTRIVICADEEEYSTDPESMERVLSATKGQHVILSLQTPNISEEIAKCVESIQLVFYLHVETKITSDVLKMMRLCVEKNTLNKMFIAEDVEIEAETAHLLVDLLKQKQFHEMFLPAKCSAALKEIIVSWRENFEKMARKKISCREGFSELNLSSTEFPFEECNEEEECNAKRANLFAANWPYITAKSVMRNQDGSAVYCLSRRGRLFKTVFVFA